MRYQETRNQLSVALHCRCVVWQCRPGAECIGTVLEASGETLASYRGYSSLTTQVGGLSN